MFAVACGGGEPSGSVRGIHPGSGSRTASQAEAQIVVPIAGIFVVPIGRPQVLVVIVPAPAAIHAVAARGRSHGRDGNGNLWIAQRGCGRSWR